ncbi:MAG: proton-conducting transporter membrane subunit, partial [Limisphaerales bacterium]
MNWTIAPILLPLLTGLLLLLLGRPGGRRRWVAALSALAQLGVALFLVERTAHDHLFVLPVGGWSARVGIALVIDLLSAIMLTLSS